LTTRTLARPATPALTLLGMEPLRSLLEYAGMHLMDKSELPRGDGHPVVIFPGLASDKHAIAPLRSFCEKLGYSAYDWGRGFNTGPEGDVEAWLDELAQHVQGLTAAHTQRVSLIGWSLGGIYAREVAKRIAPRARQVITIGTPVSDVEHTHASWVYRLLNGQKPALDGGLAQRLRTAPEVPTTSIYSRTDGVVPWRSCIQPDGGDNIEVHGSHVGMGWNPQVLSIIAEKLRPARRSS